MSIKIAKVAVLGSGVMGAQIAGHLGNAGIPSLLFDVDQKLAEKGKSSLASLKPSPIYVQKNLELITACNYESHLESISEVDWIIEAVVERLDVKEKVSLKRTETFWIDFLSNASRTQLSHFSLFSMDTTF